MDLPSSVAFYVNGTVVQHVVSLL